MNKKGFLKVLMVSLVMFMMIGVLVSKGMAQAIPTQIMLQSPAGILVGDTVLLDNFQYWNDPRSMGWRPIEPAYPVYGYGIGYGQLITVVDFQEGSRVLDVYRPASAFLPFSSQFMPFTIMKAAAYADANGGHDSIPAAFNMMSFKVRAPLAIEQFDTFSAMVTVETNAGSDTGYAVINMIPRDKAVGCINEDSVDAVGPTSDDAASPSQINVFIGRQFQDGTWHLVIEDLNKIIDTYTEGAETLKKVTSVIFKGNMYRLDDIMFTKAAASIKNNHAPYLFRIGPIYAQLYNPSDSRIIYAEDADMNMFLTYDPNMEAAVFAGIEDAAGNPHGDPNFDPNTAQFANGQEPTTQNIVFKFTVGGPLGPLFNASGISPIPIDPNNIPLQYLPRWQTSSALWVRNSYEQDPNTGKTVMVKSAENSMYVLAKALVDAGYTTWPGVAVILPAQGQVFEDVIICCRVTDLQGLTDEEIFPYSIVNYDVTNHAPLIEQLEDQFFQVGVMNTYQITATDPDLEYGDMFGLTYRATLNGLPNYQYGPWQEPIINPCTGTMTLRPQFEGALTCVVTVTDPRGMSAVGNFTIFCVNAGTWLNHPPIVTQIIQSPQVVRAGQLFILSQLNIVDPDNQPLYYSTNIGAVGADGVYTFQSEFPGEYLVQITAYDMLGGAVTQQFMLNVMPWWSY
jgi:hypothetical protein